MTCKVVRTCLLSLEQPDRPPPEAADHLAACGSCREWHRRLVRLERGVAQLPVPASGARSRLLARILTEAPARPAPQGAYAPRSAEPAWKRHERRLKRLAIAAALSAALLLVAVGLWAWRLAHENTPAPPSRPAVTGDPLLAKLMEQNIRLAGARTPRQRVEALRDLADDLHSEARSLTLADLGRNDDLEKLAGLYEKVVRDGLVKQARALPAAEHAELLTAIARRLGEVSTEADRQAEQTPERAAALRTIAAAARDGNRQLRELVGVKS
jgi:hypothetical protein